MKPDYDYLIKILNVFLEAETPTVDWEAFEDLRDGTLYDKFIFHIRLLSEKHLISDEQGDSTLESLGFIPTMTGYVISIIPWRLTSEGHSFSSEITKPATLTTIKEKFKNEGFPVVVDILKQLTQKQLDKWLG